MKNKYLFLILNGEIDKKNVLSITNIIIDLLFMFTSNVIIDVVQKHIWFKQLLWIKNSLLKNTWWSEALFVLFFFHSILSIVKHICIYPFKYKHSHSISFDSPAHGHFYIEILLINCIQMAEKYQMKYIQLEKNSIRNKVIQYQYECYNI